LCRERWLRMPRDLPLEANARSLASSVARWGETTREGDLAELPELPDGHHLRERITSTRESCSAGRCAEFARCHVFAARRRAAEADLVVVNHHLLLADLAPKEEGHGDILPAADPLILNEAHQLPELAAQFFGMQFSSRQADDLLADLPALLLEAGFDPDRLADTAHAAQRVLQDLLRTASSAAPAGQRRAWDEDLPDLDRDARALVTALCDLADALRGLEGSDGLAH